MRHWLCSLCHNCLHTHSARKANETLTLQFLIPKYSRWVAELLDMSLFYSLKTLVIYLLSVYIGHICEPCKSGWTDRDGLRGRIAWAWTQETMHIGTTWQIQWVDLRGCGDATCHCYYCSNLFLLLLFFPFSTLDCAEADLYNTILIIRSVGQLIC